MTGLPVPALDLLPGDIIHREPHRTAGRHIASHELDVQVDDKRIIGGLVVIGWHEPLQFLGSQASVCGATVYDLSAPVLVIGRAAA